MAKMQLNVEQTDWMKGYDTSKINTPPLIL